MNFRINLIHFYINFSRQEHQIDVLYISFNFWDSQVSSFTPIHFYFTVPLTTDQAVLWKVASMFKTGPARHVNVNCVNALYINILTKRLELTVTETDWISWNVPSLNCMMHFQVTLCPPTPFDTLLESLWAIS